MKARERAMSMDLGQLIRDMRKAAGMSQMKLADRIGVSYQQVQKYEKGASKLSVPRLMQFADIFGVPVTAFIEESKANLKAAQTTAAYSHISEDEARLLMLYRRLKRRKLKNDFVQMLKDLISLSEGK